MYIYILDIYTHSVSCSFPMANTRTTSSQSSLCAGLATIAASLSPNWLLACGGLGSLTIIVIAFAIAQAMAKAMAMVVNDPTPRTWGIEVSVVHTNGHTHCQCARRSAAQSVGGWLAIGVGICIGIGIAIFV